VNRYCHKACSALGSVYTSCLEKGVWVGLGELRGKLWHRSCSILYMKKGGGEIVIPESIRIVTVTTAERQAFQPDILAAGAGSDVRFFDSGATCYLAYQDIRPVGLGWMFRDSYLLKKVIGYRLSVIGNTTNNQQRMTDNRPEGVPNNQQPTTKNSPPKGAYLAGFHVVEAARGQGLYPLLLNVMSCDAAVQGMASYVDVAPGNQASLRGIEKAGFGRVGELRTVAVAGMIIRCEIEEDFPANLH
jgi:hypothetical protein